MPTDRNRLLRGSRSFIRWIGILLALSGPPMLNQAAPVTIAVFYPEVGEPFRAVFEQIIQGIETQASVRRYPLRENQDVNALRAAFLEQGAVAIVALGQRGVKAAGELNTAVPVIAGAVLSFSDGSPVNRTGISLAPDPALLLERLRSLAPAIRRVTTVYGARSAWLLERAQAAAKLQGLELVAHQADDPRAAAQAWREFSQRAVGRHDALWLMDTATLDEAAILPMLLEQAWNRNVVLFSSSLNHVPKGVLFALYPDNVQLGRRLATLALNRVREPASSGAAAFSPLQDVRMAVNLRTATHLGLDLDTRRHGFDLVFPAP